jgi:putative membrane protein
MFVDTHTQVDADLTATAGDLGIDLPDARAGAAAADVTANTGEVFDTAWIPVAGLHQTALTATQAEVENGSAPTVVAHAEAATPVVEQHIAELNAAARRQWRAIGDAWGSGGQAGASDEGRAALPVALAGVALLVGGLVARRRARSAA